MGDQLGAIFICHKKALHSISKTNNVNRPADSYKWS